MPRKRIMSRFALTVTAAALLAGCGGSQPVSNAAATQLLSAYRPKSESLIRLTALEQLTTDVEIAK